MKFIDVHCHLDGGHYGDLDALFKRLESASVEKVISSGFDLASSEFCRDLSEKYESCYFTAGFHPTELKNYSDGDLDKIAKLASHKKCVAIGEIGLDYHYPDTDKPLQHKVFLDQLRLASELNMPAVIHSRDGAEDTLNILKENRNLLSGGALMHCFSYSPETAAELLKLGLYFSFGGTSTYSGSKRVKKSILSIPMQRILTETDSPYLPPRSKAGQFPNTPESIEEILRNIADIKGLTPEEAASAVFDNAHELFKKL